MKNRKGFTLIELLAVIVILAIIALIAVPQVLKILNQARISAAEDTTYGIYNATQDYISKVLLSNGGDYPNIDLTFTCDATSCKLDNYASLSSEYNLEETLDYKGTKAKEGKIKISSNGSNIIIENLKVNEFYCNHNGDRAKCSKNKSDSQTIALYGYSISDNGYDPNDPTTIRTIKPADKRVYLKYTLTNGEVAEGQVPDLCFYSDSIQKEEFCLHIKEFETSKQKMFNYFGYDENTWTKNPDSSYEYWEDPESSSFCKYSETEIDCGDELLFVQARHLGYVYMNDSVSSCYVNDDESIDCYID